MANKTLGLYWEDLHEMAQEMYPHSPKEFVEDMTEMTWAYLRIQETVENLAVPDSLAVARRILLEVVAEINAELSQMEENAGLN